MGIGPGTVKLYLDCWQRGLFRDLRSVADLAAANQYRIPAMAYTSTRALLRLTLRRLGARLRARRR